MRETSSRRMAPRGKRSDFVRTKTGSIIASTWFLTKTNLSNCFEDAIKNGVFHQHTIDRLKMVLERRDPFLEVIGIGSDGTFSQNIDEELYGDESRVKLFIDSWGWLSWRIPGIHCTKPLPGNMPRQAKSSGERLYDEFYSGRDDYACFFAGVLSRKRHVS